MNLNLNSRGKGCMLAAYGMIAIGVPSIWGIAHVQIWFQKEEMKNPVQNVQQPGIENKVDFLA